MAQYIDKSALVAEIYKLKKSHDNWSCMGKCFHQEYENLLSFIGTLEVKDVDLDFTKEVDMWIEDNGDSNGFFNVQDLAKYFYELGLKVAQKEEKI